MKTQQVSINKIIPYEKNAKKHDKKQIQLVASSIDRFGWVQPLVVDKDNNLIIGHCRLEGAKILKQTKVPVLRVENLTEEEVKALRLADNKLNESPWEMDLVIDELKGLDEDLIDLTGFDRDLIIEPDDKDDEVPEVPEEPQSKLGDLYELGNHRVLCGDSTKIENVEKLMDGKKADMVLDTFLGSGSTLIASEKTNRICYGMELDPKYIDVIVQRYCEYTGNYNIKINGKEIVWEKK